MEEQGGVVPKDSHASVEPGGEGAVRAPPPINHEGESGPVTSLQGNFPTRLHGWLGNTLVSCLSLPDSWPQTLLINPGVIPREASVWGSQMWPQMCSEARIGWAGPLQEEAVPEVNPCLCSFLGAHEGQIH